MLFSSIVNCIYLFLSCPSSLIEEFMTVAVMRSDSEKELSWAGNRSVVLTVTAISMPMADRSSTETAKLRGPFHLFISSISVWSMQIKNDITLQGFHYKKIKNKNLVTRDPCQVLRVNERVMTSDTIQCTLKCFVSFRHILVSVSTISDYTIQRLSIFITSYFFCLNHFPSNVSENTTYIVIYTSPFIFVLQTLNITLRHSSQWINLKFMYECNTPVPDWGE